MPKIVRLLKIVVVISVVILVAAVALNLIFGTVMSAASLLPAILGGVLAYWLIGVRHWGDAPKCPNCGTQQPTWRNPATFREMLLGGWTCVNCRTEMDRNGRALRGPKTSA